MDGEEALRRRGCLMITLGWALAFFMVTAFFRMVLLDRHNPNRLSVLSAADGELTLEENAGGHFLAEGTINGHVVTFLIDTGATQVAVAEGAAERIGLEKQGLTAIQTAAGEAAAWNTRIDELQLGFIVFHDLRGIIVPDLDENTVLLGMNALGQLHITQSAGTLKLRPVAAE